MGMIPQVGTPMLFSVKFEFQKNPKTRQSSRTLVERQSFHKFR